MPVAFDSSAESASSVSQATFSWTHTPVGTLVGLVVYVFRSPFSVDGCVCKVNGVEIDGIGIVSSTDGSPTGNTIAFGLSRPPAGVLTIEITRTNNTDLYYGASVGVTADTLDIFFPEGAEASTVGALSEVAFGSDSPTNSLRVGGLFFAHADVPTIGAHSTALQNIDNGAYTYNLIRETTPGVGDQFVGWTDADSAGRAALYFEIAEYFGPSYSAGVSIWALDSTGAIWTDLTADWRADKGLSTMRGMDSSQPNLPPIAGSASFSLDNVAGTYLPGTGPIQRGTLIQIYYGLDGNQVELWCGVVDTIKQNPMLGDESVDVTCLGVISFLTGKPPFGHGPLSTAVHLLETTDELIQEILDQVNFPGDFSLGDGNPGEVISAYWWAEGKDPWTAILELLNSEGPNASLYETAYSWNLNFYNRVASESGRMATPEAEFTDVPAGAIQIARPFNYDDGLDRLINYVRWELSERIFDAEVSNVWNYNDPLSLDPDEIATFGVSDSSSVPFTGTTSLAEGIDYVVLSGSVASISLDRESGETATLTVAASVAGVDIQFLQVRARLLSIVRKTVYVNTVGAPLDTGIAKQGFNGPTWEGIFSSYIIENINSMVVLWSNGRPMVFLTLQDINDDVLYEQVYRELMDRITVVETQSGISQDYWITNIKHTVTPGPRLLTAFEAVKCISLSPAPPAPGVDRYYSEDACWGWADGSFFGNNPLAAGGWYNGVTPSTSDASRAIAGWYFPNIAVANGATILSATIYVYWEGIAGYNYGWLNADVAFQDSDNAPSFVATPSISARTLDANSDAIIDVATADFTLDITDKLQDMVDRGGWASGNALMWLMYGHTVTPPVNHNGWLGDKGLPLPYYSGMRAYIEVTI